MNEGTQVFRLLAKPIQDSLQEQKLLELLKDNQKISAQEISRRIVDDVLSFQGSLPQADDITLVLIKI